MHIRHRTGHGWLVIGLLAILACPSHAGAQENDAVIGLTFGGEYRPSPWRLRHGYLKQSMGKFGYGLKNLAFGWLDFFFEPAEAMSHRRNFLKGLGAGVKDGTLNVVGGAAHLVTFPITRLDITLPEDGIEWKAPVKR